MVWVWHPSTKFYTKRETNFIMKSQSMIRDSLSSYLTGEKIIYTNADCECILTTLIANC